MLQRLEVSLLRSLGIIETYCYKDVAPTEQIINLKGILKLCFGQKG
jgi:hypothetical protein